MTEISLTGASPQQRVILRAECIAVPFLDGYIPTVVVDGKPRVIIKPIVERLGINWASQYTKLCAARWGRIVLVTTQLPGDTQRRDLATISTKAFSLWLAGIQDGRVAEQARETVVAYQDRAGDVLDDHFFGRIQESGQGERAPLSLNVNLASLDDATVAYLAQVGQALTVTSQALTASRIESEQRRLELVAVAPKVEYVDAFVNPTKDVTLFRTYCSQIHAPEQKLRKHLMAKGVIYKKVAGRHFSKTKQRMEDVEEYHARAAYRDWFHRVDQTEAPRLHNGQLRTTLYVTPVGKVGIAKLLARCPIEVNA